LWCIWTGVKIEDDGRLGAEIQAGYL